MSEREIWLDKAKAREAGAVVGVEVGGETRRVKVREVGVGERRIRLKAEGFSAPNRVGRRWLRKAPAWRPEDVVLAVHWYDDSARRGRTALRPYSDAESKACLLLLERCRKVDGHLGRFGRMTFANVASAFNEGGEHAVFRRIRRHLGVHEAVTFLGLRSLEPHQAGECKSIKQRRTDLRTGQQQKLPNRYEIAVNESNRDLPALAATLAHELSHVLANRIGWLEKQPRKMVEETVDALVFVTGLGDLFEVNLEQNSQVRFGYHPPAAVRWLNANLREGLVNFKSCRGP